MGYKMDAERVKELLIKSVIQDKPYLFIRALISSKTKVGFPNKLRFYRCFKTNLKCCKENSKGKLTHKITHTGFADSKQSYYFDFFDEFHKNSRLTICVEEKKDYLFLDLVPF